MTTGYRAQTKVSSPEWWYCNSMLNIQLKINLIEHICNLRDDVAVRILELI